MRIKEQIHWLDRHGGYDAKEIADTMEAMLEVVEAAEDICGTLQHETAHVTALQEWALSDALAKLEGQL